MARGRRRSSTGPIDSRLAGIVASHVDGLVAALSQEIRRNVADEVRAYFDAGANGPTAVARALRPRKKRVLTCIAPGCGNTSKGPRFHYLCDKHKDSPKRDYEAWRKANKEKAS